MLRERLRPWIARGALVAVDDAGAGFTSLEYVAEIRPDFLKLCRGMVTGVDRDAEPPGRPARHRRVRPRGRRARSSPRASSAPEELAVLRDAEVDYGQGWLFGRPAEAWPRPTPRPPPRRVRAALVRRRAPRARARRRARRPARPPRRSSSTSPAAG